LADVSAAFADFDGARARRLGRGRRLKIGAVLTAKQRPVFQSRSEGNFRNNADRTHMVPSMKQHNKINMWKQQDDEIQGPSWREKPFKNE
jgi:hypothetical protein